MEVNKILAPRNILSLETGNKISTCSIVRNAIAEMRFLSINKGTLNFE